MQSDGRRLGVDLGEAGAFIIHLAGGFGTIMDNLHVAFDDGFALAAELLGDLLAHFFEDDLR